MFSPELFTSIPLQLIPPPATRISERLACSFSLQASTNPDIDSLTEMGEGSSARMFVSLPGSKPSQTLIRANAKDLIPSILSAKRNGRCPKTEAHAAASETILHPACPGTISSPVDLTGLFCNAVCALNRVMPIFCAKGVHAIIHFASTAHSHVTDKPSSCCTSNNYDSAENPNIVRDGGSCISPQHLL